MKLSILQEFTCPVCNGKKIIHGTHCSACEGNGFTSHYTGQYIDIPIERIVRAVREQTQGSATAPGQ